MAAVASNPLLKPSLDDLLPQAPPMILLSGLEWPAEESAVSAYVDVAESSPFYESALGGVPACVALEYLAQTMALCVGIRRRARGLPPQIGFILGSRRLETRIPCFRKDERYRTRAECTYEDESFGAFDCEITDSSGAVVACGTLMAYQPEGELTVEALKEFT